MKKVALLVIVLGWLVACSAPGTSYLLTPNSAKSWLQSNWSSFADPGKRLTHETSPVLDTDQLGLKSGLAELFPPAWPVHPGQISIGLRPQTNYPLDFAAVVTDPTGGNSWFMAFSQKDSKSSWQLFAYSQLYPVFVNNNPTQIPSFDTDSSGYLKDTPVNVSVTPRDVPSTLVKYAFFNPTLDKNPQVDYTTWSPSRSPVVTGAQVGHVNLTYQNLPSPMVKTYALKGGQALVVSDVEEDVVLSPISSCFDPAKPEGALIQDLGKTSYSSVTVKRIMLVVVQDPVSGHGMLEVWGQYAGYTSITGKPC